MFPTDFFIFLQIILFLFITPGPPRVVIVSIVPMLNLFDIYYRMIRKFPQLMPKESGLLTLTRVFQKPKLFTHRVGGEKLYCQMKGKCMVSGGSQT